MECLCCWQWVASPRVWSEAISGGSLSGRGDVWWWCLVVVSGGRHGWDENHDALFSVLNTTLHLLCLESVLVSSRGLSHVGLMLGQCRWRWANIKTTLNQRLLFDGCYQFYCCYIIARRKFICYPHKKPLPLTLLCISFLSNFPAIYPIVTDSALPPLLTFPLVIAW